MATTTPDDPTQTTKTTDPFAAMGGGVQLADGGWVPKNHPLANSPGATPSGGTGGSDSTTTPGTTAGGVKPPSAIAETAPGITVTGGAGTSGVSSDGTITTGTAPGIDLGNTATNDPLAALNRQRILELLNTDVTSASITDPDLASQHGAYASARERARRDQQQRQMARLNSMGLGSSGAADAAVASADQSAGQDIASYDANLVDQKLQTRRDTLQAAIKTATEMGMQEEANNLARQLKNVDAQISTMQIAAGQNAQGLQAKIANMDKDTRVYLANLDADLRRQGYSTTERLAQMETELRKYGIDVQGNLGMLNAIISMMSLANQNQQFYDNLGWNAALTTWNTNNNNVGKMF